MTERTLASRIAAPIWALCCPWRWRLPRPSRMVPLWETEVQPSRPWPGPVPTPPPGGVMLTLEAQDRIRESWRGAHSLGLAPPLDIRLTESAAFPPADEVHE